MPLYQQVAGAAVLALLAFSIAGWLWALGRWGRRKPLLPLEPRRAAPWTIWDLVGVFLAFVAVQIAAADALRIWYGDKFASLEEATAEQLAAMFLAQGLANSAAAALAVLVAAGRAGATPHDLGWSPGVLPRDAAVGVAAFCMLAPPVLMLQAALVQWYPSEHPLVTALRGHNTGPLFVIGVLVAVVIAPLVEEFFFRVLLQGWLEKFGGRRTQVATQPPIATAQTLPEAANAEVATAELVASPSDENPYAAPRAHDGPGTPHGPALDERQVEPPHWPIFVSASVFALLHYSHGPDPIPLFFLALGLGYLYRKTHRLAPSVVVHALLNGASMTMLWLELTFGE